MKKTLLVLALALLCAGAYPFKAYAEENNTKELGLSLEVGADVVSSYLWRGYNLGGLSIQPSITLDWNGLYLSGWANIGADNWSFDNLNPEFDITIGYDNFGMQIDLTHLYYFGGDAYFPHNGFQAQQHLSPDSCATTMEAHVGFHLGDILENIPLSIDWYTTVFGADCYLDENGEWKRAWSTYIELGYDFNLPLGLVMGARVGIVPWRSSYTEYQEVWTNAKTVAINNVNLRLDREFEFNNVYMGVWGEMMLNCYGLDKTNLTTSLENKFDQRLNWRIGASLYFGGEW